MDNHNLNQDPLRANNSNSKEKKSNSSGFVQTAQGSDQKAEKPQIGLINKKSHSPEPQLIKIKPKPTGFKKHLIYTAGLLLDAAIVLAIVIIIRVFIASPFQVQGGSMDHTLASNDLILVDQVFDNYQRGDVIVFIPPNHAYAEQEGIWCSLKELKAKVLNENVNEACKVPEFYVKRIIGVPGDKVVIFAGKVYIDEGNTGQQIELYEPYLSSKNKDRTCVNSSGQCSPRSDRQPYEYLVPENSYFVLGDNRTGSNDSRAWSESFVPKDNIRGKVRIVVWPIGDLKVIPGFDLIEESKAHNS